MQKVKLEFLGIAPNPFHEDAFFLMLKEVDGERWLPILIGLREAQAVIMGLRKIQLERPTVHDLMGTTLVQLGYRVEEVVIEDLEGDVFMAQMVLANDDTTVAIDARPSDAIAVGLYFDAEICIDEALLDEASVFGQEKATEETIGSYSVPTLERLLKKAVEKEDYESAALVRDELRRRDGPVVS